MKIGLLTLLLVGLLKVSIDELCIADIDDSTMNLNSNTGNNYDLYPESTQDFQIYSSESFLGKLEKTNFKSSKSKFKNDTIISYIFFMVRSNRKYYLVDTTKSSRNSYLLIIL